MAKNNAAARHEKKKLKATPLTSPPSIIEHVFLLTAWLTKIQLP